WIERAEREPHTSVPAIILSLNAEKSSLVDGYAAGARLEDAGGERLRKMLQVAAMHIGFLLRTSAFRPEYVADIRRSLAVHGKLAATPEAGDGQAEYSVDPEYH